MRQKPLIGVTAGEIYNRDHPWAPVVHGQGHTYLDTVIRAGGIPVILPITLDGTVLDTLCERIDGLLMSGGNDITPSLYGEERYQETRDNSETRDKTEKRLLDTFLQTEKPLLAVCRGMQFLNVYQGGTLYQDIKKDLPKALNHESSTDAEVFNHIAHTIAIEDNTKLRQILEVAEIDTNTHHHQAIKKLGTGLRVTARAEDDVIEAIETDDDRFIIGIQAHPESLGGVLPVWDRLFKAFIDAADEHRAGSSHIGALGHLSK